MGFLVDYISGVAGGVAVVIVGHPFDTTKTRLQTSPPGFYNGTLDCVYKTIKWEGVKGFYSGMVSPLAGQMFFRAASFATFHHTVTYLQANHRSSSTPSAANIMLAGSFTGLVISFIETPIDLVKTKLQIQIFQAKLQPTYKPLYNSVWGCVMHTIRRNGVIALWQGWSATMIRNIPANTLFFPVNELMKRSIASRNEVEVKDLALHQRLICGSSAGLCYWVLTYPLDAVKGRMQAAEFGSAGWFGTIRAMVAEGGWRSFTKGLTPCALRAVPACAALFATVDIARDYLGQLLETPRSKTAVPVGVSSKATESSSLGSFRVERERLTADIDSSPQDIQSAT